MPVKTSSMSPRRAFVIFCHVVVVLLSAACGQLSPSGDEGDVPGAADDAPGSGTPPAAASFSSLTGVVIGASCSDGLSTVGGGVIRLAAFRPADGQVVQERTITLPAGTSTAYDCSVNAYFFRQMFDSTFTRLAVSLYNRETGGSDVGYIDIATGQVTDLDAGRDGFSPAARHTNAVFDPTDDSLWYTESNQAVFAFDPHSGQARDTNFRFRYAGQTKFVVVNGAPMITDWNSRDIILPSPSGKVFARYGDSETTLGGSDFTFTTDRAERAAKFVLRTSDGRSPSRHVPVLWIDETHLVTTVDTSSMAAPAAQSLALLETSPDHRGLLGYRLLLPQTDRHNFAPAVSPDGSTMMFVSARQRRGQLYTLDLGAQGSQPVEAPNPSVPIGLLIGWL